MSNFRKSFEPVIFLIKFIKKKKHSLQNIKKNLLLNFFEVYKMKILMNEKIQTNQIFFAYISEPCAYFGTIFLATFGGGVCMLLSRTGPRIYQNN